MDGSMIDGEIDRWMIDGEMDRCVGGWVRMDDGW